MEKVVVRDLVIINPTPIRLLFEHKFKQTVQWALTTV